jgi:3-methyladenine DNA glycosylase AlkD
MSIKNIFSLLRSEADPEKAAQMKAYMRGQFQYLGIPTPERKKLSRAFLKEKSDSDPDWDFVFKCWKQPEREFQYLATDYLSKIAPRLSADDVPKLRELAATKSWWDTVDSLTIIVGDIAYRFPEVRGTLLAWSVDDNFWLRRIAIDCQLKWKEKTDTSLLEQIIVNNLGQTEFFINKAIGWSLREYGKTNPRWVRGFIKRHRSEMASLSIKEASKYI